MKFRQSGQSRASEPPSTVTGVAPWFRCYAEQATEPVASIASAGDRPWRVYTAGCETLRREVFDLFRPEPTADRTVAVLGPLNERGAVEAAVLAAQDAVSTGELVAVSDDPAWTSLWASLHAEHPATGITAVRTRLDQAGLRAASGIGAVPGQYRELTVDTGGLVRELVARPAAIERAGPFPLGQDDVVLISRSAGPAGLALAQVLACCGAGVAVVGRDHPGRDDVLITALEKLRQAGAPIGYEIVNPASATALEAAVRRIERRLGPVTALAQAVRTTPARALASLDPADVRAEVADQARLLEQFVNAAGPLKLIITFGSIAGCYGLAENATAALASSALADHAERIAAASPGCHMLHVDWPQWSGTAQIPIAEGSRLLLNLLAATNRPARLAIMTGVLDRALLAQDSSWRTGPRRYRTPTLVPAAGSPRRYRLAARAWSRCRS